MSQLLKTVLLFCVLGFTAASSKITNLRGQITKQQVHNSPGNFGEGYPGGEEFQTRNRKAQFNQLRHDKGHDAAVIHFNEEALQQLRPEGMHLQNAGEIDCTNPPLGDQSILNNDQDVLDDDEYVVTTRHPSDIRCFFNATGRGADETHVFMGFQIPYPLVAPDGTGRRICFTDLCPARRADVRRYNAQRASLWNIDASYFAANNMSMPYVGLPVAGDKKPLLVEANGLWDFMLEYIRWYDHIVTAGVCVRMIDYHPGDYTFDPNGGEFTILQERANDINNALDLALVEAATEGSFFSGQIDTTKIGCTGHSDGGSACMMLAVGDSIRNVAVNNKFTFIITQDGAQWEHPYSDIAKLNMPVLQLNSQDELAYMGIIRVRQANQHPVREAFYTVDSVHQHYQINDCALSQLARQNGAVVNSFSWVFPGVWYAKYCAPDVCSPIDTQPYINSESHYNIVSFYTRNWINGYIQNDIVAKLVFNDVAVELIQRHNFLGAPFVHIGPQKCGNSNWDGSSTALQVQRTAWFYAFYSSSSASTSFYYFTNSEIPYIFFDCAVYCPFWSNEATSDGEPTQQIVQPTLLQLASPQCLAN